MTNYKLRNFSDIPGETSAEKLAYMHRMYSPNIAVQQKINGVAARSASGMLCTRQAKYWDRRHFPDTFWAELKSISEPWPTLLFFGELFIPDLSFQEMVGQLSVARCKPGNTANVQFWIFDCFDMSDYAINQPFKERWQSVLKIIHADNRKHLRTVMTHWSDSAEMSEHNYNNFISMGAEGVVYYCEPAFLLAGQSKDIIKRKKYFDAEGTCVGVRPGEGKRVGMLGAMIIEAANGRQFSLGGGTGMDDKLLTKLWKRPPLNKKITYRYEDISKDGVPLRPQFMAVRDYE